MRTFIVIAMRGTMMAQMAHAQPSNTMEKMGFAADFFRKIQLHGGRRSRKSDTNNHRAQIPRR